MKKAKEESPNDEIDASLSELLTRSKSEPVDVMVKVIQAAISWEKVKHGIRDQENPFNPDDL